MTQKNISKIDSSAKFLLSIVNDILDMSKIESGKIQIESRPFSMDNLLRQRAIFFLVMAEERKTNYSLNAVLHIKILLEMSCI